eukprot:3016541-Amphidinium_carterae.1
MANFAIGFDAEARDKGGRTLLHYAAGHGYEECASILLDQGANPNAEDKDHGRPLDDAEWWFVKGRMEDGAWAGPHYFYLSLSHITFCSCFFSKQ